MADLEMGDCNTAVLRSANRTKASQRWRSLAGNTDGSHVNSNRSIVDTLDNEKAAQSSDKEDADDGDDVDIELIRSRTYLLSAGIGDTNKSYNKYKGWVGLVVWCFNFVIHFGLDFYESVFVFDVSWATCIGLFMITLIVGCYSMVRHSVPWFIKAIRKLKRDGHYPKTLRRVRLISRLLPFAVPVFAVGAAMGQFGCYAYDGALKLSFTGISNKTGVTIPPGIDILGNVLRAVSLTHIFYGFCLLLLFHLTVVFMIQSSMHEFNDRMGKIFRESPVSIAFPEAVNLFSARARFVREGSAKCSIVLTTLLVACSTSFVLNAYNFLFLKRFAIYVWFALAPQLWCICPLVSAAWTTRTYTKYKLVVVNAWVDIPEEHELEPNAHESSGADHVRNTSNQRTRKLWGNVLRRAEKNSDLSKESGPGYEKHNDRPEEVKKGKPNQNGNRIRNGSVRQDSQISLHMEAEERKKSLANNPSISLTNVDESSTKPESRGQDTVTDRQTGGQLSTTAETNSNVCTSEDKSLNSADVSSGATQTTGEAPGLYRVGINNSSGSGTTSRSKPPLASPENSPDLTEKGALIRGANTRSGLTGSKESSPIKKPSDLALARNEPPQANRPSSKTNFLSGMAMTFNRWRTKTKKKRKFNYEKYITYLESILPTVGFSIGGVIITYNGIYTFIVIITFLVGVFAQEAFFGN